MSTQWTNKYAIMRDLSLAQGCDVPAALSSTLGMNEKPPAPNIKEETEEDYFGHCLGDGDTPVAPDLGLIQQMLEMVRGTDVSSDLEDEPDKVLEITKPPCKKGTKKAVNIGIDVTNNHNIQNVPKKDVKKRRQNVAVNSILEAIAGNIPISNMEKPSPEPLKLLKPTDFMSTEKEIVDSVEKVKGWLDSQQNNVKDTKPSHTQVNWEPSSMFKRKSNSTVKSIDSESIKSSPPPKVDCVAYRPSSFADEYYQTFVERSKIKAFVKEDMWARAERIMKEMDAIKKSKTEAIAESDLMEVTEMTKDLEPMNGNTDNDNKSPEVIQLPQHRHLLTGECVVCAVVKGRGFDVDPASDPGQPSPAQSDPVQSDPDQSK